MVKVVLGSVVFAFLAVRCGSAASPAKDTSRTPAGSPAVSANGLPASPNGVTVNGNPANDANNNGNVVNGSTPGTATTTGGPAMSSGGGTTANGTSNPIDGISTLIKQLMGGSSSGLGGKADIGSGCIEGDAFTCQVEASLVKYTNDIRAQNGKQPLTQNFRLSFVARDWSIKQGGMISHTGFPSARVTVFQQKFPGIAVPMISGENVAMNSGGGADADALAKMFADQWKNSPGHFANMIGPYSYIGIGISCPNRKNSGTTSSQPASGNDLGSLISSLISSFGGGTCTGTQIFAR